MNLKMVISWNLFLKYLHEFKMNLSVFLKSKAAVINTEEQNWEASEWKGHGS